MNRLEVEYAFRVIKSLGLEDGNFTDYIRNNYLVTYDSSGELKYTLLGNDIKFERQVRSIYDEE